MKILQLSAIAILAGCGSMPPGINIEANPTITSTTSSNSESKASNKNDIDQNIMRDNIAGGDGQHCDGCRETCLNRSR